MLRVPVSSLHIPTMPCQHALRCARGKVPHLLTPQTIHQAQVALTPERCLMYTSHVLPSRREVLKSAP